MVDKSVVQDKVWELIKGGIEGHSNSVWTIGDNPPEYKLDYACWQNYWDMVGLTNIVILVPYEGKHCSHKLLHWMLNSPQYGGCFLTKTVEDAIANGVWLDMSKPIHLLWSGMIAIRTLFEFDDRFEFVDKLKDDSINLAMTYYIALFYHGRGKEWWHGRSNTNHYPIMDNVTTLTDFVDNNKTTPDKLFFFKDSSIENARAEYGHNIALSLFKSKNGKIAKDRWGNEFEETFKLPQLQPMIKKVGVKQTLINFTNDRELWS